MDVIGFEVSSAVRIGPVGNGNGGDACGKVIHIVATEVEVNNVIVYGHSDHRHLKAKAGGPLAVRKELFTGDHHALLFGCAGVGHYMPEGGR